MNLRRELIALAIRILHYEKDIRRRPEPLDTFINQLFGLESYDQKLAREIDITLDEVTEAAKRANLNRKFKKITKNL